MNRGEIRYYYGPPTAAGDNKIQRPMVIVSANSSNHQDNYRYATVIPITSKVKKVFPMEVDLGSIEELEEHSKAQPQNVFTCAKTDLSLYAAATLPEKIMQLIDTRLRRHLGL